MQVWDFQEFLSYFEESSKELDIGDNIAVFYKGEFTPIKINGEVREELKIFKGSYCIYEMEEEEYFKQHSVEMIVLEEYSDSANSIYINALGEIESYEYPDIHSIEIGKNIILHIQNQKVVSYEIRSK